MRGSPVLVLLLVIALATLAGCTMPGGNVGDPGGGNGNGNDAATLPAPIEATGDISASGDPLILASGAPCSTPTAQCVSYPLTLNLSADVTATLTWGVAANDFDLYIFANGTPTSMEGTNVVPGPGTSVTVTESLGPGDYEAVIVPFFVTRDSYTLLVEFARNP